MKQIRNIILLLMLALMLTACKKENEKAAASDISQYKTDYIGDAPSVVNIVSGLDYPKGYYYDSIEIQSQEEPYGLTVLLRKDEDAEDIDFQESLEKNADITLNMIGNLGILNYRVLGSDEVVASYRKD